MLGPVPSSISRQLQTSAGTPITANHSFKYICSSLFVQLHGNPPLWIFQGQGTFPERAGIFASSDLRVTRPLFRRSSVSFSHSPNRRSSSTTPKNALQYNCNRHQTAATTGACIACVAPSRTDGELTRVELPGRQSSPFNHSKVRQAKGKRGSGQSVGLLIPGP